jgi:hypothetical protein
VRAVEDLLRNTFAHQVRDAPVLDDPASPAIRGARRARGRRHLSVGVASVLALAVMSGGMLSVRDHWWQEPPGTGVTSLIVPPPEAVASDPAPWDGTGIGLEIRVANWLWTTDGDRLLLSGSALVERAYRTPYGLLYGNGNEILLRSDDGVVTALVSDAGHWQVSPDAAWIVRIHDGDARVMALRGGELGEPVGVEVPDGTIPVMFWGERVVLAGPDGAGYDVWDPADSDYVPVWTDRIVAVYGQVGDDLAVLADGPDGACLVLVPVAADALHQSDSGDCHLPLPVGGHDDGGRYGWLAPGGQWIAVAAGHEVLLVEIAASSAAAAAAGADVAQAVADAAVVRCPRREPVEPVWLDDTTLLTADEMGAIGCHVDGSVERLGLPERLGTRWAYVPALGAVD